MKLIPFFRLWQALPLALVLLLCAPSTQAEPGGLAASLNRSGQQRMLSQRIVKAYCQLGLGVMPEASAAQLANAIKAYEANLDWLQAAAPDQFSGELVGSLRVQWKPFKVVALAPPTRAGASMLLLRSERLLEAAENLTSYFEVSMDTPLSHLINVSGRQRMLSQRLAMFHMLQAWGFEPALAKEEYSSAFREFTSALADLAKARENSAEIVAELDAVRLEWEWLSAAPVLEGEASAHTTLADGSETILRHMEYVTALYESLARTQQ